MMRIINLSVLALSVLFLTAMSGQQQVSSEQAPPLRLSVPNKVYKKGDKIPLDVESLSDSLVKFTCYVERLRENEEWELISVGCETEAPMGATRINRLAPSGTIQIEWNTNKSWYDRLLDVKYRFRLNIFEESQSVTNRPLTVIYSPTFELKQ